MDLSCASPKPCEQRELICNRPRESNLRLLRRLHRGLAREDWVGQASPVWIVDEQSGAELLPTAGDASSATATVLTSGLTARLPPTVNPLMAVAPPTTARTPTAAPLILVPPSILVRRYTDGIFRPPR